MSDHLRIPPDQIGALLQENYRLEPLELEFLPLGYDLGAAKYKVVAEGGQEYFLKLRSGPLNAASLQVPPALVDEGVPNVVAPLRTTSGTLWGSLEGFTAILYPFVQGESAMNVGMNEPQWVEFGTTLKAVHSSGLPSRFACSLPQETFTLPSAKQVRELDELVRRTRFASPAQQQLADFWQENAELIGAVVDRAERLGRQLQARKFEFVLCHADIHAANILVADDGHIRLVDWDGPMIAPIERDLLFVIGSVIARQVTPQEEEWFFRGYGRAEVDPAALTYYRYERAIEDIGEFGRSVWLEPHISEEARQRQARILMGLFGPKDIVELARSGDPG